MKLNALEEELSSLKQNIATMKQDLNTTKVLYDVVSVCVCVMCTYVFGVGHVV